MVVFAIAACVPASASAQDEFRPLSFTSLSLAPPRAFAADFYADNRDRDPLGVDVFDVGFRFRYQFIRTPSCSPTSSPTGSFRCPKPPRFPVAAGSGFRRGEPRADSLPNGGRAPVSRPARRRQVQRLHPGHGRHRVHPGPPARRPRIRRFGGPRHSDVGESQGSEIGSKLRAARCGSSRVLARATCSAGEFTRAWDSPSLETGRGRTGPTRCRGTL